MDMRINLQSNFDLLANDLNMANGLPTPTKDPILSMMGALRTSSGVLAMPDVYHHAKLSPAHSSDSHSILSGSPASVRSSRSRNSGSAADEEKINRRRERERKAAARSRKRKADQLGMLTNQVEQLRKENADLMARTSMNDSNELKMQRRTLFDELSGMADAKESTPESKFRGKIEEYHNLSERIIKTNIVCAENASSSIESTQFMDAALWMLIGDTNGKSVKAKLSKKIKSDVSNAIGITSEQWEKLDSGRTKYEKSFHDAYDKNAAALDLIKQLEACRASMAHYISVSKMFREQIVQGALSTEQSAELLVWIEKHQNVLQHLVDITDE